MIFIFLFLLELIVLFFLSRMLTRLFSLVLFQITKSQNATIQILAILFFPGVVVHELSHLITAGILFVPAGNIEFMPKLTDGGVKLGSVSIATTDPVRRAIIGFAPILVGLGTILGMLSYFPFDVWLHNASDFWKIAPLIYIVFQIGNTMFSSKKDMEGTLELLAVIGIFVGIFYYIGIRFDPTSLANTLSSDFIDLIFKASMLLAVPIGIDVVVVGIMKVMMRGR